ncbi:MAG: arginine deiminase-related protein [Balneolaceae bacterium]|nr:arginine deiminase-related protein [Balneolaceae bacterium]
MSNVITSADQLDFSLDDIPSMPLPKRVLLVRPTYYTVEHEINPHMKGQTGKVDKMQAEDQWEILRDTYRQMELQTEVIEGEEGLDDMVFCANQSLPFLDAEGNKQVIMSIMKAEHRRREVPYLEQWYRRDGYEIFYLNEEKVDYYEGCGDAICHDGLRLLWGGHGFRSTLEGHRRVSELLDVPVLAVELIDDAFYHLDTCLCVLDRRTALVYPDAFTGEGMELIETVFERVIRATSYEARKLLACNAVCPDGRNVIIQKGCTDVNKKLRDAGYQVHEVDTSEYLKSGGSVFCMKQMVW